MESNFTSKKTSTSVSSTPTKQRKKKYSQDGISESVPNTPMTSRRSKNSLRDSASEGGTPIRKKRMFGESIFMVSISQSPSI